VSSRKDNNNFSSLCVYFENVECICEWKLLLFTSDVAYVFE
jgi:hypothetical protein